MFICPLPISRLDGIVASGAWQFLLAGNLRLEMNFSRRSWNFCYSFLNQNSPVSYVTKENIYLIDILVTKQNKIF